MELSILRDVVVIFALSCVVNFIFTRIKVPTIIGYLFTGIVAGPHLLGLVSHPHQIDLMAEIGVVLLMFSIGLEFSLQHLLKIRWVVFVGGMIQFVFTTAAIMLVARMYGLAFPSSVFVGFLVALSSTAVVLKLLQDRSELTSNYGRTVLGILIFQDIVVIPLMLFTPLLAGEGLEGGSQWLSIVAITLMLVGMVYAGNRWIMPWLLHKISLTRNQELFSMSVLLICLSVALLTSSFGMSLAFGAFLAGLMISESNYSHNAFGNLLPFKDTFASFFFVSIGMLLDLHFVIDHLGLIAFTVFLVWFLKAIIAAITALILGHTFKGTVLVGMALSQVGEFSFILARVGIKHHLLTDYFYQLFLAVAIITMSLAPFLIILSNRLSNALLKLPMPVWLRDGIFPLPQVEIPGMRDHVVIIGKDSRAMNLAVMARYMNIPYVSVIFDPFFARKRQQKGEMAIYGDAVNEPILLKAHTDKARIVVVSVGALVTAMAIVEKVRNMNKKAYILVRTKYVTDIEELYRLGANQVIPEEFETAIELFRRILMRLLIRKKDIETAIGKIREDHYGIFREEDALQKYSILNELPNIEIIAMEVQQGSPLIRRSLNDIQFRKNYGVTVVAIRRNGEIIEHPSMEEIFQSGDSVYLMGKPEQISATAELFGTGEEKE